LRDTGSGFGPGDGKGRVIFYTGRIGEREKKLRRERGNIRVPFSEKGVIMGETMEGCT